MTAPVTLFLERMKERQESFGNVVTKPLMASWEQLCRNFNAKLRAVIDPNELESWTVLCPPTGSGKTQSLIVYSAITNTMPRHFHPGIVIVTRRIADADQIAQQINELTRQYSNSPDLEDTAVSYHSEVKGKVKLEDLASYPVLVICHKAYTLAMQTLGSNAGIADTWGCFYSFDGRRRNLVVIDEAIDLVSFAEIDAQQVRLLINQAWELEGSFPMVFDFCRTMLFIFKELKEKEEHPELMLADRPVTLWDSMRELNLVEKWEQVDFTEFKKALWTIRMSKNQLKQNAEEDKRLSKRCTEVAAALDDLLKTFLFYSHNGTPTFNTARLIVPPNVKGGVILDATATCNTVYELFDKAQVVQPIANTRNYQNVTIHPSYNHKVGKSDMRKDALSLSQKLIADLEERFKGQDRKVLIVTHKDVEPYLVQCLPESFTMSVAHWGAVDGSNDWNDHDTVVLFGLPYKPKRWDACVFMGYQGVRDTQWLNDPTLRHFRGHQDIRKDIRDGQIITDLVQAINRVRCRRIVDTEGNCEPTDVFIMLPTPEKSKEIMAGIVKEMPNVEVNKWEYSEQQQKKRGRKRGNWDQSLVSYLTRLNEGDRLSATSVKSALAVKAASWEDLIKRVKDTESETYKALQEMGVVYETVKQRSSFVRLVR